MMAPLSLTLTPTLCAMLRDPLLQARYTRHLENLIELMEKEIHRTLWEEQFHQIALFYRQRLAATRKYYEAHRRDLVERFGFFQREGLLEILTCAATHALLPLLGDHKPSVRAQILVARDSYRDCFGREPNGIWLPECAYAGGIEALLGEANLRWFIVDTHGLLQAQPRPRYGMFAPVWTPNGIGVFGRDRESANQVWSRQEGYPGDARYRDFYRDIGFDLELEYLKPYLPAPDRRSFTGIKYYRITGADVDKRPYERKQALAAAEEHARHFLAARIAQLERLCQILDRPPLVLAPYDAELFGHWWYEGPEFLDLFVRKAYFDQKTFHLITPQEYLLRHPTNQVATPAASSWGEGGYWRMWLNETNEWIYSHLQVAQERMTELARLFSQPDPLQTRALQQAARELLLAQASDWPFILRTGTSPDYARQRVKEHLLAFSKLYEQLKAGRLDEPRLAELESRDNLFPQVNFRYWA
jgi:1,4-alpha-glucan branching enzyme